MPNAIDLRCITLLDAGASSELGIVIKTNDPMKARANLYRVRKELANPEWIPLTIRVSPNEPENEIWLIRNASSIGLDLSVVTHAQDL